MSSCKALPDIDELFCGTYGYKWDKDTRARDKEEHSSCIDDESDNSLAYYYTTVKTFQLFLESGCIFASHIKYMNDWKEFSLGRDMVIEILEECNLENKSKNADSYSYIEGAICRGKESRNSITDPKIGIEQEYFEYWKPEVFSISLSSHRDLLSQWKMYARESGVAIGFDFSKTATFWQETNDVTEKFPMDNKPKQVKYKAEDIKIIIKEIYKSIKKEQRVYQLISLLSQIPFIKHDGFFQEGETRLVFRPFKMIKDNEVVHSQICYRLNEHILIPYLKIMCGVIDDTGSKYHEGWPIASITVGPGHDQEAVFASILHYIEFGEYKAYHFSHSDMLEAKLKYIIQFYESQKNFDAKVALLKRCLESIKKGSSTYDEIKHKLLEEENEMKNNKCFKVYSSFNYLSSKGIIISRSQIPYIFN